jgi:hypothetical protein
MDKPGGHPTMRGRMRQPVSYLLVADDKTYRRRTWADLAQRLVWAHRHGVRSAKARRTAWEEDLPLLPSEAVALVEAATELALAAD